MRKNRISETIGNIDQKYVSEATAYTGEPKAVRRPVWIKWGAIAACFAIIFMAGIGILHLQRGNDGGMLGIVMQDREPIIVTIKESLKLLAEYFSVSIDELLPDKSNEEILVSKNKTIVQQKKIIIGLLIGCGIGLFALGYIFIVPLRESLELLGLGTIMTILGAFNMRGNIASIHWYNRRKVTKENQKPYCMCVGLGTLIIGVCLIIAGLVQSFVGVEQSAFIMVGGVLIGLTLILYAQIKYNRGLF